ncbi:NnrU family protein [Paracoccus aestuariivivens]|uniref:NnrU family protein n=2 Tax=Paracoccus aestuariivivens TaxID=1820333 RepID=A0A6L6J3I9_9RHOB|nr:NnrU family protein [Paracoccus aestuariivivens]MTH76652.1 NnrU family protein [Paracoccus aestuariivivens]
MEWAEFAAALGAFLASHVIPARLRGPLVARVGRRAYLIGYSLLSLALLYWLIVAAGRAPFVEIWPQDPWMRWLVNITMPVAILAAAIGGMAGLMSGFALWAMTHLVANGDLAHVILFGLLLAYALFGLALGLRKGVTVRLNWQRIVAALLVWATLFHLHPLLTGVSPLP